jgi:hypothetical protein
LPSQAEVAPAGGNLESAVGVIFFTRIGVLMITVLMMRLGKLLEKMMHSMGRGIDQEK